MSDGMKSIGIVNAGAGSGKTYRLIEGIYQMVSNGLDPAGLMAITFTNKAAAELTDRIQKKLIQERSIRASMAIGDGYIGTVNAVCGRLLTEFALDAGLSPSLDVLPEEDSEGLFRIAVDEAIANHIKKIDPVATRLSLDGKGSGYAKNRDWRDDLRAIVQKVRANNISVAQLDQMAEDSWRSYADIFGAPTGVDLNQKLSDALDFAIDGLGTIDNITRTSQGALDTLVAFKKSLARGRDIAWSEWVRIAKVSAAKDGEEFIAEVCHWTEKVLRHPDFQQDVKILIKEIFSCAVEALSLYDEYKHIHGLMDFTDQETKVLELCRSNAGVREALQQRLHHVFIDEFQDTSPIQLALFLELNSLASSSTWVGDPKQAIYGFRGADPLLMNKAAESIGTREVLHHSWRSKELLLTFFNAVFPPAFPNLDREKVTLTVPTERIPEASGGFIESWNLVARNKSDEITALAEGVKDFLERHTEYSAGDIAILCRKNDSCTDISTALEEIGIHASYPIGKLLESRECQLIMAGLRYLYDEHDTLALVEIAQLHTQNRMHSNWLALLMEDSAKAYEEMKADSFIEKLDLIRPNIRFWTPGEALREVIHRLDVNRLIQSWSNSEARRRNLEALSAACTEYTNSCRSSRRAVTIAGYIQYVYESDLSQAQSIGENSVQVLTYHKAKGLEWPVVIMVELNTSPRETVYGVVVKEATSFDLSDPLQGRSIHYRPWPFGKQKKFEMLTNAIESSDEYSKALKQAREEAVRLLYVGMTRAREGLILAVRKASRGLQTAWLDQITDSAGESLIQLPEQPGEQNLTIDRNTIPLSVFEYLPVEGEPDLLQGDSNLFIDKYPETLTEQLPGRMQPSDLDVGAEESSEDSGKERAELVADFQRTIQLNSIPDPILLGDLFHAWLAVDDEVLEATGAERLAQEVIERHRLEDVLEPSDLVISRKKLSSFVNDKYPNTKVYKEWPLFLVNDQNQQIRGWADMLIETENNFILLDHKTYAGKAPERKFLHYENQLKVYSDIIEAATGKSVAAQLIHLPILGKVYQLE